MKSLYNQNVMIIGSDSEIIRALSAQFAKEHSKLFILHNNKKMLENIETDLGHLKVINYGYFCNFDVRDEYLKKIQLVLQERIVPDILIMLPIAEVTCDLFSDSMANIDKFFELKLIDYLKAIKIIASKMMERQKGYIVNIYDSFTKDNFLQNMVYHVMKNFSTDLNSMFSSSKLKNMLAIDGVITKATPPAEIASQIFKAIEKDKQTIVF